MSGDIVHEVTRGRRESRRFNAVMLLVAQGFITLIGFIVLYFGMTGLGCPASQCTLAAALNLASRWALIVIFAATALVALTAIALGRAPLRIAFVGAIVSIVAVVGAVLATSVLTGTAIGS